MKEEELNSSFNEKLEIIKKYKNKFIVSAIVGIIIGLVVVALLFPRIKDKYEASVIVYSSYDKLEKGMNYVCDYANIITDEEICNEVAKQVGIDEQSYDIQKCIEIDNKKDSGCVYIYATSDNAKKAMLIANNVATTYVKELERLVKTNVAQIKERGNEGIKTDKALTRLVVIFVIIVLSCLLICTIIVVFKVFTSKKILIARQCSLDGDLEIIGILPDYNKLK